MLFAKLDERRPARYQPLDLLGVREAGNVVSVIG